jgi:hypothetical protein
MHRRTALSGIWLALGAVLGGEALAAAQATPCPDAPTVADRYTHNPAEPILLIGTGNARTTLDVPQLGEGSIGFVVYYGGHDRFEASLVAPGGERSSIFTAIRPTGESSARRVEQVGEYVIEVEANGPWSIVVQ